VKQQGSTHRFRHLWKVAPLS